MFSRQQAQTGKRIYGGVTQAPNQGQVSAAGAQGYIKRELRNKNRAGVQRRIGSDGLSDNRSAVAAGALGRMNGMAGGPQTSQRKKGPSRGPDEGRPKRPGPKGSPRDGRAEGRKLPSGSGPFIPGQTPQGPPPVVVTEDGILQLPYNQDFSAEQLSAINEANDELLALKMEGDQQALEYGSNKRNADLAYDSLKKQTLNQNAAGGTAFSSQYGTGVANNATGYANEIGDLELANSNFLNNQTLQQSAIQSSLNQQLAALAQQYADDLNSEAGSLGYGQAQQGGAGAQQGQPGNNGNPNLPGYQGPWVPPNGGPKGPKPPLNPQGPKNGPRAPDKNDNKKRSTRKGRRR